MLTLKPTDEPKALTVHLYDISTDRYRFTDMTRSDIIDATVKQAFFRIYRDILHAGSGRKIEDVLRLVSRTGPCEGEVRAIRAAWVDWWSSHKGRVFERFTPVSVH